MKKDVFIIGGGIIGLMSAYYLTKAGVKVTIADKGPKEQASSHANCGLISPSHIMPLNNISLILKSFGMMFKRDAAFKIKPQADWAFLSWLIGFLRKSTSSAIEFSSLGRLQLLLSSAHLYRDLIKQENLDCHWSEKGLLFVCKTKKAFDEYVATDNYTRKFDIQAEPLVGQELLDKEPALLEDLYGAWYYDIDNWLKPDLLLSALTERLTEMGVELVTEEVTDFVVEGGTIKSVSTHDDKEYNADAYVLATGAWSPLLGKKLKLKVPIIPGKGYSITMDSPALSPKLPCIMMEKKVVATPWKDSYRLGSTMELAGYDDSLNEVRLQALKKGAEYYLKQPYTAEIKEKWWGWRPMTFDGLPIIDKSPKHHNLWLACGHSMLGMSMGTGTGKLIAEMITGQPTHVATEAYSFQRFVN